MSRWIHAGQVGYAATRAALAVGAPDGRTSLSIDGELAGIVAHSVFQRLSGKAGEEG